MAPLFRWAAAVFTRARSDDEFQAAWLWAVDQVAGTDPPIQAVRGPATATVYTAKMLYWHFPAWYCVIDHTGYHLDMRVESPATISKAAAEAYLRLLASESSLCEHLAAGIPYLEPVRDVTRLRSTKPSSGASLRAFFEGVVQSVVTLCPWAVP